MGEEMHGDSLRSSRPDGQVPSLESGLVGLVGAVRLARLAPALVGGFSDALADDDGGLVGGHGVVISAFADWCA